jgi:hypothetical protein
VLPLLFGAAAVVQGIGAVLDHQAQKKQAKAVRKSALKNLDLIYDDLDARAREERAAALQQQEMVELEGGALEGQTVTSAAAANVQGATVDALLKDVQRQEAQAKLTIGTNLSNTEGQIARQKRGAIADAEAQIAGAPNPSSAALGMRLAGIGLNSYTQYRSL